LSFKLSFTKLAEQQLLALDSPSSRVRFKKVRKTLGLLQGNPRYPGLNSHKYSSLAGANGEDVWESYVENRTPSAWRVFWHYGPGDGKFTIVSIAAHPD
jgi:hypothetical protein